MPLLVMLILIFLQLKRTNLANIEHASNVFSLLAEIYECRKSYKLAAASLISALGIHPQFPLLWRKLGQVLENIPDYKNEAVICFNRADQLTDTFRNTLLPSFVREEYFGPAENEQVSPSEENPEFVDLGSSKRKQQHETEKKPGSNKQTVAWIDNEESLDDYLHNFTSSVLKI